MPENKPKRRYHRKATQKQLTAIQLIAKGMSARQAMLKAGYSSKVVNQPGRKLLRSQAITTIVDKVRFQLQDEGLTTAYIVKKMKELTEDPDSRIKLETIRDLRKLWGIDQQLGVLNPRPSRRITLEEFVGIEDSTVNGEMSNKVDEIDTR